jgi:hypothetical protein
MADKTHHSAGDAKEAGDAYADLEQTMRARFGAMEAEVRRLRARNGSLGLGLVAALVVAAGSWIVPGMLAGDNGPADVLEARSLVLVDADGQPRGEWSVDLDGNASLKMFDPQQRERISFSVRDEGHPGMALSNAAGERRMAMGLLPDQTTTLVFADGAGVPRAVLGLVRGDAANFLLADADGVSRIGFGLDGRGIGSVILPQNDSSTDDEED